jgi:predicted aconitase with swiveling domain
VRCWKGKEGERMAGDIVILPVTRGDRGGAAVLAGSREGERLGAPLVGSGRRGGVV